jgi:glutamine amidotransferase-like uncharacterized protein
VNRILIYNAKTESKLDSLKRVLGRIFDGTGMVIEEVTADDIQKKLTADVALLIFPGARAGTAYREQLKGAAFDLIKQRMQDGLQVLGICAGSYVMTRHFTYDEYDPVTGKLLFKKNITSELGITDFEAFGPDLRLYPLKPREADNPWSVYTAAAVRAQLGDKKMSAALALSKGPSFINVDETKNDIIARYEATGDAAIVGFRFGKGGGVLSGPALEVGGDNLAHYIHPEHRKDPHCAGIVLALERSAGAWAEIWGHVMQRLLPNRPDVWPRLRRNLGLDSGPQARKAPDFRP